MSEIDEIFNKKKTPCKRPHPDTADKPTKRKKTTVRPQKTPADDQQRFKDSRGTTHRARFSHSSFLQYKCQHRPQNRGRVCHLPRRRTWHQQRGWRFAFLASIESAVIHRCQDTPLCPFDCNCCTFCSPSRRTRCIHSPRFLTVYFLRGDVNNIVVQFFQHRVPPACFSRLYRSLTDPIPWSVRSMCSQHQCP